MVYKITYHEASLPKSSGINSTALEYGRFRTYAVEDENGRVVFEAEAVESEDSDALVMSRADCEEWIDLEKSRR